MRENFNKTIRQNRIYLSVLLYPLWTIYLSFKHFRMPQAKNLFWLFCCFLGLIHIYSPDMMVDEFDGYRIVEQFISFHQNTLSFDEFLSLFYQEDGMFVDLYLPVITYFLSIVTGNPRFLFFVFALIFGFFFSRNIWFVLEKFPSTIGLPLVVITIYYILICPIWIIDGGRMGTAIQVFVFGALPYLYNSDKSKLIWCIASLFIHFSMFLPLAILLVYYFVPKSVYLLLSFYILSIFIMNLNLEVVRDLLSSYLPSFLLRRVDWYTNESYAQHYMEAKSNLNFYVEGSKLTVRWVVTVLFLVSGILGNKIIHANEALKRFFCFSLFIYSIANIISFIPSAGRFIPLSQMFAFVSFLIFHIFYKQGKIKKKEINFVFNTVPALILFPIIYSLRVGCDYYGISLFLNPVAALFVDDNQPIIHFFKSIF